MLISLTKRFFSNLNFERWKKMEVRDFRSVVKYFHNTGMSPLQIKTRLDSDFGTSAPSIAFVYKWCQRFDLGFSSTKDEPRPGRPKYATSQENIEKVSDLISKDRRIGVDDIANAVKISRERAYTSSRTF